MAGVRSNTTIRDFNWKKRGIPNPMDTEDQFYRYHNLDLRNLDIEELLAEFDWIKAHAWQLPANSWWRGRMAAIEGELKTREVRRR